MLVFGFSTIYAQQDPKAEKVIKAARKKFYDLADMKADFSYTMENKSAQTKPSVKSGKIAIKKEKYHISLPDQEMICDGKTVWALLKKEKEVNISNYNPKESMSLQRVFKYYDDGMKTRFEATEPTNGVNANKITLFPNSNSTDFFKVEMWVDATDLLRKIKIHNRNGTIFTYDLKNVTINSSVPDAEFLYDKTKFPGFEEVDLRD